MPQDAPRPQPRHLDARGHGRGEVRHRQGRRHGLACKVLDPVVDPVRLDPILDPIPTLVWYMARKVHRVGAIPQQRSLRGQPRRKGQVRRRGGGRGGMRREAPHECIQIRTDPSI